MLRECHRVLKPGGQIAGYIIHTPMHLNAEEKKKASEWGPGDVVAKELPGALLRKAGFNSIYEEDVTDQYLATCEAFVLAREKYARELRAEYGEAVADIELEKKRATLAGIQEGLLRRAYVSGQK